MSSTTHLDLTRPSLWMAAASIVFNPVMWNIVARREHRTRFLTKAFGGSSYAACYFLAASIFTLGLLRDFLFTAAIDDQPASESLQSAALQYLGAALVAAGSVFVFSSMYTLGVTGTYLGDYCGILMEERVTSFPFNVLENPMYWGSTLNFVGTALWKSSAPGLLLALVVGVMYKIAIAYEGPFTAQIYADAEKVKRVTADVKRKTRATKAD